MSDIVKQWFIQLYEKELESVKGAISNERLWQKGADSIEQATMHEQNIVDLLEYENELMKRLESLK